MINLSFRVFLGAVTDSLQYNLAIVDPSDSQDWQSCVERELARHEGRLNEIAAGIIQILQTLAQQSLSPSPEPEPESQPEPENQAALVVPRPNRESHMTFLECYSGKSNFCRAFLTLTFSPKLKRALSSV